MARACEQRWGLLLWALVGCMPSSDLDRHARGSAREPAPSSVSTETLPSAAATNDAPSDDTADSLPLGTGLAPTEGMSGTTVPLTMTEQEPGTAPPAAPESGDA